MKSFLSMQFEIKWFTHVALHGSATAFILNTHGVHWTLHAPPQLTTPENTAWNISVGLETAVCCKLVTAFPGLETMFSEQKQRPGIILASFLSMSGSHRLWRNCAVRMLDFKNCWLSGWLTFQKAVYNGLWLEDRTQLTTSEMGLSILLLFSTM